MSLIYIRHAQSTWNAYVQQNPNAPKPDIVDPPLTPLGEKQIKSLAERLEGQNIKTLITSPYRRTIQSALLLSQHHPFKIEINPFVRERCGYACDIGSSPSELAALWPQFDFNHLEVPWWGPMHENSLSVLNRAFLFKSQIRRREDRKQIAIMSHWAFIRAATGQSLLNAQACKQENNGRFVPL